MEERLEVFLDAALSSRRTAAAPARALSAFSREEQDFVLRWVEIIARSNAEVAFQFASHVPKALEVLDEKAIEAWIIQAMDAYDRQGLHRAVSVFQHVEDYLRGIREKACGIGFEQVEETLFLFIQGLSGRKLRLQACEETYTDTETLFLPPFLCRCPTPQDNFRLYKATAAHLWAQTRYGTFHPQVIERLEQWDEARIHAFHVIEGIRLDACIARELPGLHREMMALRASLDASLPTELDAALSRLKSPSATAQDTLACLAAIPHRTLEAACYQGALFPRRVIAALNQRREREKLLFRQALARLAEEKKPLSLEAPSFKVEPSPEDHPDGMTIQLHLDGQPIVPPEDVQTLMTSIVQDLGEIPEDYLVPAGDGGYAKEGAKRSEDVWKGTYHEEGAFLYKEWDFRRGHYRKDWCVLRERDVHPRPGDFVEKTRQKYHGLIQHLKKSFEIIRGEDKVLKKQPMGDEVDIDAWVEAHADVKSGLELSERLFVMRNKIERDIAVMFMVDMSGSTKGWINDAEREALVLLCEALEILGDRYAIYGFSGITRKRCELYRIKRFDEPYHDEVKARISGITPQDYTRMGVAIRHLAGLLNEVEAKSRLLITLSDGKPDDYDGYRGEYGIEDTRKALLEARQTGIHPFCITIDKEGRDYLPHMYGAANYALIDEVRKLPLKVADIYRKLTT